MKHVQIEVHKGIATVTKLVSGIEVELVDLDVNEVVVFRKSGKDISAYVLNDEELAQHK